MIKKRMILFGGSGLLGTRIRKLLSDIYIISAPGHVVVNLEDKDQLENYLSNQEYDLVVCAAGVVNQKAAQEKKELAKVLNFKSVSWIAKIAKKLNVPVVYFSTDAVFKGTGQVLPYTEKSILSPVNYYGLTKSWGEKAVLLESKKNLVIRISNIYSPEQTSKQDLVKKIILNLSHETPCYGIVDQYFNPSFTDDVVNGLDKAIKKNVSGILHFGSSDYITNFDFTKLIAKIFGYDPSLIVPITFKQFFKLDKTSRGQYTCLDISKAQKILGKGVFHTNRQNLISYRRSLDDLKH